MLPVDPTFASLTPVLLRLQTQAHLDWSPVISLLHRLYPTTGIGPPPLLTLPQFPSRAAFEDIIKDILTSVSTLSKDHPATWTVTLPSASLVFQLYHLRAEAAARFFGGKNPSPDGYTELLQYMRPMNAMACALYGMRGNEAFRLRHGWVVQFATRQLTTIKLYHLGTDTPEEVFYIMLRASKTCAWLGLLYEALDRRFAHHPLDVRVNPAALLDVAELITEPLDGASYQISYALSLVDAGLLSAACADYLSPAQLHALRPAADIWYELYRLCLPCNRSSSSASRPLKPRQARYRCSGCRRVYYCNTKCQTRDWISHKEVCELWRRVDARSSEPEMQARISCLELDPESELVNI